MSASSFEVPITDRYFEDYIPGSLYEFGTIPVEEAEVIEYAKRFDPQEFHTDVAAAARGPYHGLIASGWHTAGLMMRLLADNFISKVASLGSPGVDELRWILPVRPGDLLRIRVSVLESRRSRSKPDRGIVWSLTEVLNQKGEIVASAKAMMLFRCRKSA